MSDTDSAGRATKAEKEHRRRIIVKLLLAGKPITEVRQVLADQFKLKPRQITNYVSEAKAEIAKQAAELDTDTLVLESLAFYRTIQQDPNMPPKVRIKARENIDLLLGLRKPTKIAPTNPDGTEQYSLWAAAVELLEQGGGVQVIDAEFVDSEVERLMADDQSADGDKLPGEPGPSRGANTS